MQIALANDYLDRISPDERGTRQSDARLAQDTADIVLQSQELLATYVVRIHFEQDVGAAL